MDKLTKYRQLIQNILIKYSEMKPANGDIKVDTFFDLSQDHYQVFHTGWDKYQRIFGPLIHIDIIDSKIWIQYDGTEIGIANELVELGVPSSDIVLGYHAPFMRQYDDFAIN